MTRRSRGAHGGLVGVRAAVVVAMTVGVAGCSDAGNLSVFNEGPGDVTVLVGDEELRIDESGGTVLLDHGCTPGDVTVELETGDVVVVDGPVCPDEEIVVRDGEVTLEPAETGAWP